MELMLAFISVVYSMLLSFVPFEHQTDACTRAQSKWDLWKSETCLRGANIWQRIIDPKIDGTSLGTKHVGPPYSQADFDELSSMGANYVNLSVPGLFTETPPYVLDEEVKLHLEDLLLMASKANLFVVISFRTGPGRNEAGFDSSQAGRANHRVWSDVKAQEGWVTMWQYAARLLRSSPVVAGYDLMVEPNSSSVLLKIDEPRDFYPRYRGSPYDWNVFARKLARAVREVDTDTPILMETMGYSHVSWLAATEPIDENKVVYIFHQYEPFAYSHQEKPLSYPGFLESAVGGIEPWLGKVFSPVGEFQKRHFVPVAVNEFGVKRWAPGSAAFVQDEMKHFERLGLNHAIWLWGSSDGRVSWDDFDVRKGPLRSNHTRVSTSRLIDVIKSNWSHNRIRPSDMTGR